MRALPMGLVQLPAPLQLLVEGQRLVLVSEALLLAPPLLQMLSIPRLWAGRRSACGTSVGKLYSLLYLGTRRSRRENSMPRAHTSYAGHTNAPSPPGC